MQTKISALAMLFGATFLWFATFSLAETASRDGSPVNQIRLSQVFHSGDDTARVLQEQPLAGNNAFGGALGFGFGSKPTKNGRNRPSTRHSMTGPGFAYSRSRGPYANPDLTKATQGGNAECTAEHWSSGKEAWPRMVPIASTAAKIFGSRALEAYGPRLTLLDGLKMEENGDGYSSLLKQSSTALINSYSRQGFPYSAWRVKTLLIQSLVSTEAAASQAAQFLLVNTACSRA